MKNYIALLLFFYFINGYSQNLLKYNGDYKNGKAEYTYFENEDLERIYQGNFKYENDDINYFTSINGFFKNNLKSGNWNYLHYHKHSSYSTNISGRYEKDLKNGIWKFNDIQIKFHNDTIIGPIKIDGLQGKFDEKGKYLGQWNATSGDYEYIAEFQNNSLIKLYERIISTGEIKSKYAPNISLSDTLQFISKKVNDLNSITGLSPEEYEKEQQIQAINSFFSIIERKINFFKSDNFLNLSKIKIPPFNFYVQQIFIDKPISSDKKIIAYNKFGIDKDYQLAGRMPLEKIKIKPNCEEEGIVVVSIEVDRIGNVTNALAGIRGTTSNSRCLLESSKKAALSTKFNPDNKAPNKQIGKITYEY